MHYKEFVDFLIKYEEINIKKAIPDEPFEANLLSGGDGKFDFKQ